MSQAKTKPPSAKRNPSLTQQVVTRLTEMIQAGHYTTGDRLPTEPEVMAELGVSRGVVREAISRLQAAGLVETKHGVGTFVLPPPQTHLLQDPGTVLAIRDVLAMLELRVSFETEAAGLAAQRRTEPQMNEMQRSLEAFDVAMAKGESAVEADYQFHVQIALATGNRYFEDILRYLGMATIPRTRLNTMQMEEDKGASYLQRANHEHRQVFQAIARGDTEAARAAMRIHLVNSQARLRAVSGQTL